MAPTPKLPPKLGGKKPPPFRDLGLPHRSPGAPTGREGQRVGGREVPVEPRPGKGVPQDKSGNPVQFGALQAFVHALVAAGHEVRIQAKPVNQPRRRV